MKDLANIRKEYSLESLDIHSVQKSPYLQFELWFNEVLNAEVLEPNAMFLATATKEGVPSGRVVLLKGLEDEKFVFFTNYESQKGKELSENPFASITFFWAELERQVRIAGKVEKMPEPYSKSYFESRPFESKLGAWASRQSSKIDNRSVLENKFLSLKQEYTNKNVPKPDFWGGYGLKPISFEFWQGREGRLHDRIFYSREANDWNISRLSP